MIKPKILISISVIFVLALTVIGGYLIVRSCNTKEGEFSNAKLIFSRIGAQHERIVHD